MAPHAGGADLDREPGIPGETARGHFENLLIEVAQNRDQKAFLELFGHFAPRVKSYLMKAGLDPSTADDVSQEVMLTVWRRASSYDPSLAAASTWIFTIARNKRIDALRRMARPEVDTSDPLFIGPDESPPSDSYERAQEVRSIAEALRSLPGDQADILYKAYFEDKTHQAIAEEENLPLGTVKSRIRLALERLRKQNRLKELWT